MARIFGIILPDDKRIGYALTLLYGIGRVNAGSVLKQAGIDAHLKVGKLTDEEIKKIVVVLEKGTKIEGDLREEINSNVKRLKEIGSYRGLRHSRGLPVRGQRTKSNSRTKKGKRKTVGALKKEVWAKLDQAKATAPPAKQ